MRHSRLAAKVFAQRRIRNINASPKVAAQNQWPLCLGQPPFALRSSLRARMAAIMRTKQVHEKRNEAFLAQQ